MERVTAVLEMLESQVAPRVLVGLVVAHLKAVIELLEAAPPPATHQALLSLAGELAGLAGWLVWDTGDVAGAGNYFRIGLEAAREAGDTALGAYLKGGAACQPSYREKPAERLRLLEDGALGFREMDASPTTQAWLATLEAEAWVIERDADRSRRALERADRAIDLGTDDPAVMRPRVAFFDRARLAGEQGLTLARLGVGAEARTLLESALGALTPTQVKIRPRLISALATAHVWDGEVDEACRLAVEALRLASAHAVEPNLQDVRRVRQQLVPWQDHPAVRQLDEQLHALA